VGPNRHRGQTDPDLLASCFRESLRVAGELGAESVAFPAISAGAFGWDVDEVARIAVVTVRDAARTASTGEPGSSVQLVRFVPFDARAAEAFRVALEDRGG
jgi:O-acetyl-ADP-ribose deacetylase